MKSHAVLSDGAGIPGVSGLEYAHAVPTRPLLANDPGVVPSARLAGLSPTGGSAYELSTGRLCTIMTDSLVAGDAAVTEGLNGQMRTFASLRRYRRIRF